LATSAIWRATETCHDKVCSITGARFPGDTLTDFAEGEALARSFGCKFIETSAKSRINVDKAFFDIVREIRRYNREMQGYSTGSGGTAGANGPPKPMDMDNGEQEAGCCAKCVLM
jgi:GTPase KRas protein